MLLEVFMNLCFVGWKYLIKIVKYINNEIMKMCNRKSWIVWFMGECF